MNTTFATVLDGPSRRYRLVYDEDHETRGSYAYDTEEETLAAEEEELAKLASGEWVVLGIITEVRCETCEHWHKTVSVWGCVMDASQKPASMVADILGVEVGK